MKKFLVDSAEVIIYASGAVIFIAGFYIGIQLIRLSGTSAEMLGGGSSISPIIGIFFIVAGLVFAALHCLVWLAVMDIRTYTRYSAKAMTAR